MNANDNPNAAMEAWAMLLAYVGWDREADLIFAAIEKREAEAARTKAEWSEAFTA